jgi:hypothetical protein
LLWRGTAPEDVIIGVMLVAVSWLVSSVVGTPIKTGPFDEDNDVDGVGNTELLTGPFDEDNNVDGVGNAELLTPVLRVVVALDTSTEGLEVHVVPKRVVVCSDLTKIVEVDVAGTVSIFPMITSSLRRWGSGTVNRIILEDEPEMTVGRT